MTPMIKGLGGMTGATDMSVVPGYGGGDVGTTGGTSPLGGGGSGSATDGLGLIDSGAGTVRSAINQASTALGGGGGGLGPDFAYKKGGYVKGGKINLGSGRVSTASKNKSNSNW